MQWSLVHYQPIQLKKSIDVDSSMTDLNEKTAVLQFFGTWNISFV